RALALAHPHLGRLVGHRHVREDPDPDPALALHLAGDRAAGRLDLPGGDPFRLHPLQAVRAEIEREAAIENAMDAAFELLAVLGFLRRQHDGTLGVRFRAALAARATGLTLGPVAPAAAFAGRPGFAGQPLVLRHRVVLQ